MACERCGAQKHAARKRVCSCPASAREAWIIRESLYGRWTAFSRRRQAALAAVAALLLLGAGMAATRLGRGPDRDVEAETLPVANRAVPTLILPTALPVEPEEPGESPAPSEPGRPGEHPADLPVTYSGWAGPGCADPSGGEYREEGRRAGDGPEGANDWYTVDSGGYAGGSCDGTFAAVPMSGSRTHDGPRRAVWRWNVGEDSDECAVAVHIPRASDSRDVAGDPTTYRVLSDPRDASGWVTFEIDQTAHRGRLFQAGSWPVENGRFAVKMLDRGEDRDSGGPTYAHHAAAQMKVTCRASS